MTDLMIILGSPASGKTTLARRLMGEFSMPCLCKDDVKEALLDLVCLADLAEAATRMSEADRAGDADCAGEAKRASEADRAGDADCAGEAKRTSEADRTGDADCAGEAKRAREANLAGGAKRAGEASHAREADRVGSRLLSDVSFAAVLRLARTQLEAGVSCLIEGNWRAAHAAQVGAILEATGARAAQVWCRARPPEIRRRFMSRTRHSGHLDAAMSAEQLLRSSLAPLSFLDLSGPRWIYDSDDPAAYGELQRQWRLWRL